MQPNYATLPDEKIGFSHGYYIVTWDDEGNYKSHKYYGSGKEGAKLGKNQTLELRTGGGWLSKD